MPTPNPLIIPAGYAECVFSLGTDGPKSPVSFSIGAQLGSTESSLATNLLGWFSGGGAHQYGALVPSNDGPFIVEVTGHSVQAIVENSIPGFSSSVNPPPGVAVKVKKLSGVRGKANKGYMFCPRILDVSYVNDTGAISSAVRTSFGTLFAALLTAMSADGSSPVILHHALSSVTSPTPVTGLSVLPYAAYQRRRASFR